MKLPQTGGCLCGALRYEITRAPQAVYTCHCTDCQRLTGSAFSMALFVADEALHLSGVDPRPLQKVADSGRKLTRWLCAECGAWIYSGEKPGGAPQNMLRVPFLDPQQTALGNPSRRRPELRDAARRLGGGHIIGAMKVGVGDRPELPSKRTCSPRSTRDADAISTAANSS